MSDRADRTTQASTHLAVGEAIDAAALANYREFLSPRYPSLLSLTHRDLRKSGPTVPRRVSERSREDLQYSGDMDRPPAPAGHQVCLRPSAATGRAAVAVRSRIAQRTDHRWLTCRHASACTPIQEVLSHIR